MSSIPANRQSYRRTARKTTAAILAWLRGNGVALTVLAGLLLIGSLALTQSAVAILAFARFGAAFNQVAHTNLPNLLAASRLSELSQSLVARAPELAAAGSQTQRQGIADRLNERLAALADVLDRIDWTAIDAGQLQNVRLQRDALATNLRALDDFVQQRIDADNALAAVMARLPALAARVRNLADEALISGGDGEPGAGAAATSIERPRLIAWSADGLEGITLMLGTPAVETKSRLERIGAEFETLVSRMEVVRSHLSPQMRQKIDAMHYDIVQFGSGVQGIFQARQAQIEAGTAIRTSLRLIDQNTDKFLASVSTISGATQQEISGHSANLNQTISHFNLLIMVTSLLCVLAGGAIFAYVQRAVIMRLKRVQEYMRAQVEGRPAEMSTRGADEIAEIARATRIFVTRIANREAALQQRTVELSSALEQQIAAAEVLQVINSSPGDLAPVFDAMLERAMRLCEGSFAQLDIYDGERFQTAAMRNVPRRLAEFRTQSPPSYGPDTIPARLIAGDHVVHVPDLKAEPAYQGGEPNRRAVVDLGGARAALAVPLRKDGALLGEFTIYRREVRPFTDEQIALLQNFAAQAVIAMDNARLITELRQRTRDLQESLEYQTASGDVLKVISRSGAELGPVLDMLVETAARICRADSGFIFRLENGLCRMVASFGIASEYRNFLESSPIAPSRGTLAGRIVLERRAVHIEDAAVDPEYTPVQAMQLGRQHTMLGVPLTREDALIGVITLARSYVEPFTEKQIGLVTSFAAQAVIAIENARLFNELRDRTAELGRSVDELKMMSEVGRAVSSTLDLRTVLSTVLTASLGVTWANAGAIFRYSPAERAFRLIEAVGWEEALVRSVRELRVTEAESAMGEAALRREPVQLRDLAQRASYPLRDIAFAAGFRSALIVPLVGPERILGAIILLRQEAGEFPPEIVRLMQTLASQSVLAIQNAQLFREIAAKSEQLALASQHKSQFLASMSHELRTPLNAILGYAELLVDGIYGELPERPRGVLERIQNNGKHLLALINDVLDLAKIEAGQLTLTLEDYSLPEVIKSVVTATEPLATSKGLRFIDVVQSDMPTAHGDARRVSQVMWNLVGNAIKFTDAGEVEIRAAAEKGQFVLTVRDTGPGIAEADQERIFGEFQQIDNTNTRKKGGTGLGLAIAKRMIEIQGGTISVNSALGQGSTFRVVLPVHVDEILEETA